MSNYKINKTFLLIIFLLFPIFTYAGIQQKINLSIKSGNLSTILSEIRQKTGVDFIYNEKHINNINNISISVNNAEINEIIDKCLKNTNLTYSINNNIIAIYPKKVKQEKKDRIITGIVVDENGGPLPGVNIIIKELKNGIVTNSDGTFRVKVNDKAKNFIFSFIGMKTKTVPIPNNDKPMRIVLIEKVDKLSEVVVTGYKQTTKREATGSVGVITKESFSNQPIPVVDNIIQGKIAGVSTTQTTGRPGASSKIRIRGINTITGNAEPLWVINGVPMQKDIPKISTSRIKAGDFNDIFTNGIGNINPSDIENISVLKDASAAAIYGSRAAGGVIVVTTKKGKAGKMRVNYSSNVSVILKPQRDANTMNTKEKLAWEQELWDEYSKEQWEKNGVGPVIGVTGMIRAGKDKFGGMNEQEKEDYLNKLSKHSTDWFGELFRNSVTHNHYLSISGGKDVATYYISAGYSDNKGLVKNTDYTRYNMNSRIDLKPNKKLNIGVNLDISTQKSNSFSGNVNPYFYAYFANPYERPYNEDGSYRADQTYFTIEKNHSVSAAPYPKLGFNILREINETSSEAKSNVYNITTSLNYRITDKLRFSGLAAYSFTNNNTDNINGKYTYAAFLDRLSFDSSSNDRIYGSKTQFSANNNSYTLRGQFNYSTRINDNNRISIIGGSEIRGQKATSMYSKRYGYDPVTGNSSIPIPPPDYPVGHKTFVSFADAIDALSGQYISEDAFASFYASVDYFYTKKYAASFTVRTDGSNHFGSDQQFNPTWSLGGAWHIDQEPFMYSLSNIISNLSLKLATGYTGNTNKTISPYLIMDYSSNFRKTNTEAFRMGNIRNAPNPNLRWEKTRDYKAAIDIGFFENRLNISSEVYYRLSKDVVSNVGIVSTVGFTSQGYNTSEIENKGYELTINALILDKKDFKWRISINGANNINTLTKYRSPTGTMSGNRYLNYPLNSIFGGKLLGIDPTNGMYKFKLRSDAIIKKQTDLSNPDNYKFYLGTSNPPISGGFSSSVNYKRFTLSIGGNYSFGAKILNKIIPPGNYASTGLSGTNKDLQVYYNDLYTNHYNVSKNSPNRWTQANPITNARPRIVDEYFGKPLNLSNTSPRYTSITNAVLLEDISFLRIKSISLGYSVNPKKLRKLKIQSLGFNASLNNFLTFTNYSGIDPESAGAVYPITRSISVGMNMSF